QRHQPLHRKPGTAEQHRASQRRDHGPHRLQLPARRTGRPAAPRPLEGRDLLMNDLDTFLEEVSAQVAHNKHGGVLTRADACLPTGTPKNPVSTICTPPKDIFLSCGGGSETPTVGRNSTISTFSLGPIPMRGASRGVFRGWPLKSVLIVLTRGRASPTG